MFLSTLGYTVFSFLFGFTIGFYYRQDTMECGKCGTIVDDKSQLCPECGNIFNYSEIDKMKRVS